MKSALALLTIIGTALAASQKPLGGPIVDAYLGPNATALRAHALELMDKYPLIDTHVDMPQILRTLGRRPLDMVDDLDKHVPGHVDIPRMKEGKLGGLFMTVYSPCPNFIGQDPGPDFLNPLETVRDNIEMFDLIQNIVDEHPDTFAWAYSSADIRRNFANKKISALIGIEGAHTLGNSLSTLRIYAQLGAKYLTLTHICHNAFASSAGWGKGFEVTPIHPNNGLSDFGRALVLEMNRLGMMVDLAHVSWEVMQDVLDITRAPVVFTHSGAAAVNDHPRNVPDYILKQIGSGKGQNNGIILSVFYPIFIGLDRATVGRVADHIEHIASVCGRAHVGIASDFDGMYSSVEGLEDASKYPQLIMELLDRGWSDDEIKGVMGENLLRVMDAQDAVKESLKHEKPARDIYEKRQDLPAPWGGEDNKYLPTEVRKVVHARRQRDEL